MASNSKLIYCFSLVMLISLILINCQDKQEEVQKAIDKEVEKSQTTNTISSKKEKSPTDQFRYFLPSPDQLFVQLGKISQINWNGLVQINEQTNYSDIQIALNIGSRSADGLVLVHANDMKGARKVWNVINELTRRLNLDKELEEKQKEVKLALENIVEKQQKGQTKIDPEDNKQLRRALKRVYSASEKALKAKDNEDLAILVGLGGWIEGLYLVSNALSNNYDAESAKLLRQSHIVNIYGRLLSSSTMGETVKNHAVIQSIIKELPRIRNLTSVPKKDPVPKENIIKLYEISKNLKSSIEGVQK